MKKYWEQLKPLERRWAVGMGCLVFVMLNYFFIWPHRHDWARDEARTAAAEAKIATYNKEVAKKSSYEAKLRVLEASGDQVLPEDQAIDFVHFYSSRLLNNHVLLLNGGTLTTRTNVYFTEQQLGINVQADETNLVNFLYSLAEGDSMVRVRAMNLHADPGHHELNAGITMVASYQRKVIAPAATATSNSKTLSPSLTPAKNTNPSRPSEPANKRPELPIGMRGKFPQPPGANAANMNDRMARFLRPGMTNKPPR